MNVSHVIFTIFCIIALVTMPHVLVNAETHGSNIVLSQFQLRPNQTASEPNNIDVKFLNVTDDSRCPSDVTCIWQGKSTITVNVVKSGQNVGDFSLTSGLGDKNATAQILDGYFLQLTKIEPYPKSGTTTPLSDYVATFELSKYGILSPLKQFKSGTSAQQVQCNVGFELIIKATDNSPACVLHSSVSVLINRGWAIATNT
ncbi:MAG TPA: hypothetical protein VFU58_05475 [Candidatus Nitrosotalea sp.]|nr:hypothetical protein [Candidatus Nitrosotalea sp.]